MNAAVICLAPPYPIDSGTRLRSASVITCLKALGYKVTVFFPDTGTSRESLIQSHMELFKAISFEPFLPRESLAKRILRKFAGVAFPEKGYVRTQLTPQGLERLNECLPVAPYDLLVTSYAINTTLSRLIPAKVRLLDTCDLMSVHKVKVAEAHRLYRQFRFLGRESFISFERTAVQQSLDPQEIEDIRFHDCVVAIAEDEERAIRALQLPNMTTLIGPSVAIPEGVTSDYLGNPIFPYSPNIFNVQGLLHFIRRVAPIVLEAIPDFRMTVTGSPQPEALGLPYIDYTGYVDSMSSVYCRSSFAIIGAYDGTGQQLKVVEAMAHRLPVVGYGRRIDPKIVESTVDGFMAGTEREFADAVIRLWKDREMVSTMGCKALEKVSRLFSQEHFNSMLGQAIGTAKRHG